MALLRSRGKELQWEKFSEGKVPPLMDVPRLSWRLRVCQFVKQPDLRQKESLPTAKQDSLAVAAPGGYREDQAWLSGRLPVKNHFPDDVRLSYGKNILLKLVVWNTTGVLVYTPQWAICFAKGNSHLLHQHQRKALLPPSSSEKVHLLGKSNKRRWPQSHSKNSLDPNQQKTVRRKQACNQMQVYHQEYFK